MDNPSTIPDKKPKLYTCILKCAHCMKTLGSRAHVPMTSGIRIDHNDCPEHPRKGFAVEWEPE